MRRDWNELGLAVLDAVICGAGAASGLLFIHAHGLALLLLLFLVGSAASDAIVDVISAVELLRGESPDEPLDRGVRGRPR